MFKKTAGVVILFVVLFTLSVGRVSADREVWHADGFGGCSNAYCQIVPGNEGGWIQLGVLNKGVTHEVRVSTNTVFQEGDKLIVGLYDINVILTPDAFVTNAGDSVFSFVATEWTTHFMVYGNCPHTSNCGATAVSVWEIAATPPNGIPETTPIVASTGGGGGLEAPASGCSDAVPGGAPVLLSAASKGNNSAILTWTLAPDPVTYYLLTYGTASGVQTYGNPNVGGRDTKSYTVNNLSGGTSYYFRIRAGNGCAPGPYSNELSTKAGGIILTGPAAGFIPGVLGVKTQSSVVTPIPTPTPSPNPGQLEWILTHKNISGRIALILLANVYVFYLSNKKRNNF